MAQSKVESPQPEMNHVYKFIVFVGYNSPHAFMLRNNTPCDKLSKSVGMRYSTSCADPGLKMRVHLLTAPGILVIWAVTHRGQTLFSNAME
jgi:hypothetical protein